MKRARKGKVHDRQKFRSNAHSHTFVYDSENTFDSQLFKVDLDMTVITNLPISSINCYKFFHNY